MKKLALPGRVIFSAAVLLASSACAYGVGAAGAAGQAYDTRRPVQLQVVNQSGVPIEVYVVGAGTAYRVGTVHPGLEGRFVVRPAMVGNGAVEFTARFADGRVVRSGPMLLAPGAVVDFALTPHAATSNATVRVWARQGSSQPPSRSRFNAEDRDRLRDDIGGVELPGDAVGQTPKGSRALRALSRVGSMSMSTPLVARMAPWSARAKPPTIT